MMSAYMEAVLPNAEAGDRKDEFAALVADGQRRVFQIAYSLLANRADAEEVVQEVYLRAFRKYATLRDPKRFHTWVNRIAFRLALNLQRARRRQLARDTAWYDSKSSSEATGAGGENEILLLHRLRREIDRLPEKLRAVLLLCTVEEMDARTVAETLDIPVGTVSSRLHVARKRLLEALNL